uniref:Uncharacterized protein n=1 Tax=uncultured marine virus TaxID=186617 RepID=A0A0F7LAJ8_9VIRU|nr:hypothetical protein [uncultured marine virus]
MQCPSAGGPLWCPTGRRGRAHTIPGALASSGMAGIRHRRHRSQPRSRAST